MKPIDLYNLLHREPFQPLRVYLTDGRVYDIRRSWHAIVGVDFLLIGVPRPNKLDSYMDHTEYIAWELLQKVEDLSGAEHPTAAPTN